MMNVQIFGNKNSKSSIFFIHGNSQNLDIFRFQYESTLFSEYRLVGIDLPGHGQSSKLARYSIENMAQKIVNTINELRNENCFIVAHSLGGHLVLQGISDIKNLKGVLLVGTPPLSSPADMPKAFFQEFTQLLFRSNWNQTETDILVKAFTTKHFEVVKKGLLQHNPQFKTDQTTPNFLELFKDEWQQISYSQVPVYLSIAANDMFVNPGFIKESMNHTGLINVHFKEYSEGGHLPFLNNAKEFNNFLNKILRITKV